MEREREPETFSLIWSRTFWQSFRMQDAQTSKQSERWKLSTISGRSDFRKVSWFSFYFKSQIWTGRTEIRVHIFIFFQNANLAVQIFGKVFTFSFLMKIKMWTPFLSKSVQKRCSHFDFHQKRKCEHLFKNLDGQICDLKKLKMWTPFQKSGRPDLRF